MKEALQNRDEERGRLAGARLGAANHVVADERERNDPALHRARVWPSEIANPVQEPLIQAERGECERSLIEFDRLVGRRRRIGSRPSRHAWATRTGRPAAAMFL
jgi:hypothetical protein